MLATLSVVPVNPLVALEEGRIIPMSFKCAMYCARGTKQGKLVSLRSLLAWHWSWKVIEAEDPGPCRGGRGGLGSAWGRWDSWN